MELIGCKNVSLSYEKKAVISDLSFSMPEGGYLCIVGENGAGKSTLMKGILGILNPSCGSITYSADLKKNEIGYLPQSTDIQKDFPASCHEVVLSGTLNKCGFLPFYSRVQRDTAKKNMQLLGIYNLKNRCFRELSGGQQQRVLLARALCATGKLLVLDEPVAGLDPVATRDFYEITKHLNKTHNISIIMVSHDITGIISYATHILHLEHDNTFFGTVNEYLKSSFADKFVFKKERGDM